MTGYRPSGA